MLFRSCCSIIKKPLPENPETKHSMGLNNHPHIVYLFSQIYFYILCKLLLIFKFSKLVIQSFYLPIGESLGTYRHSTVLSIPYSLDIHYFSLLFCYEKTIKNLNIQLT